MASREKHAYCFKIPKAEIQPIDGYNEYAGQLVFTQAVSPAKAANNAIFSTFHPTHAEQYGTITKYLHSSFDLTGLVVDIDELDRPAVQAGLFGGVKSSHRRLDENDIAQKIARRFGISNEGEKSRPKQISKEYIRCRTGNPLKQ